MKTKQEIKLLKQLKELAGKVKYDHNSRYDGRRGTTALMKIADKYYVGTSYVSHKDVFDKKIGRSIALGRAFVNYQKGDSTIPEEQAKFKEDR